MIDPFSILGIEPGDDDGTIRAAYLRKVREFPPDRDAAQFQKIRAAWETIRDRAQRFELRVFGPEPFEEPEGLIDLLPPERHFAGPNRWLAVIKERREPRR